MNVPYHLVVNAAGLVRPEVEGAAVAARVSSEISVDIPLQVGDEFFGQAGQSRGIDSFGESRTAREQDESISKFVLGAVLQAAPGRCFTLTVISCRKRDSSLRSE